jgi:hypothetical protein
MKIQLLTYETVQAPPATVLLHPLHFQIPTAWRLTLFLPQKVQMYRACWVISIFFTCLRSEAPYLLPESQIPFNSTSSCSICDLAGCRMVSVGEGGLPCAIFTGHADLCLNGQSMVENAL